MNDSQMLVRLMVMNTIGMSILFEAFHNASFIYKIPRGNQYMTRKEVLDSYAFVQGTGLDILLQSYHLDYDPDQLRNGFNYYMKKVSA